MKSSKWAMVQKDKIGVYLKSLLVLLLILSNFKLLAREFSQNTPIDTSEAEFFPKWEKRFVPIKKTLPFEAGVIGYASEGNIAGTNASDANAMSEHILTQFSMTPIIVSDSIKHEWILVNMEVDEFDNWLEKQSGAYQVVSYQYNLYLVHKIK